MQQKLINIIEKTPISFRNNLTFFDYDKWIEKDYRGFASRIPYRDLGLGNLIDKGGLSEFGIALSLKYGELGKTLLHECLHIHYQKKKEDDVINLTNIFWKIKILRKIVLKRLTDELGRRDL